MNKSNTIFVIDIDGTLIKGQSQRKFISFFKKKGVVSSFSYVYITVWFLLYKLHLVKDSGKILLFGLKSFKGKTVETINDFMDEFIRDIISPLYFKHSKDLLQTLKDRGGRVIFLSSAVEIIVQAIAKDLNISEYICTKVQTQDGKYTGEVEGKQVYGAQKSNYLNTFLSEKNISMDQVVVLTDHYSDIPLLKTAGKGIVTNPDAKMYTWAKRNNFTVIYLDDDESIQYIESHTLSQ